MLWKLIINFSTEDFIKCLNNSDLASHLMESELCPSVDELSEHMQDFKDYDGIVEQYRLSLEYCAEAGMIRKVSKLKIVEAESCLA